MSILVFQLSWWGRESWLLCFICFPVVSWWLRGSSSRCHGVVCGLWLWYFLIILTYFFLTMLWKSWILTFWPHFQGFFFLWGGGGLGCRQNIYYHVAAFVIQFNLLYNMTMLWKSWILTYLPRPQGRGRRVRVKYYYHVAAFVIFFIWYATWLCFEKVEFGPFDTIQNRGGGFVCEQNICFHVTAFVNLFNLICNMTMLWKSWIFTIWPNSKRGGWG